MNALALARDRLLSPAGLDENDLERALGNMLGGTVDGGDVYCQYACSESWGLEDGIVKHGHFGISQGIGVRALSGEQTGFAYTDQLAPPSLQQAARMARAIGRQGGSSAVPVVPARPADKKLYPPVDPVGSVTAAAKLELLQTLDAEARRYDPRVSQVMANLNGGYEIILVMTSEGLLTADFRPLVRLQVTVIAEADGQRERASAGGGGRVDYAYFSAPERGLAYAREAARKAVLKLEAVPAPAGTMPVILGPGWPGVLLHEAVGHGLEGDYNRKGTSAFAGRLGERVAAAGVTVVDDGSLPDQRGSLQIDDEGTASGRTVLIDNGILKGYLQDRLNARLMGMAPTGNGRRQSFAHRPLPRMTNTFMLAGTHTPEAILASVDKGLYAVNFGGGQVDITSGKFVFTADEAYLIENHRVTRPVKGATLIGSGPEVLNQVSLIGNDLSLDDGIGTCGKQGQSVPVGVGQPTLRVDQLTVGGTQPSSMP